MERSVWKLLLVGVGVAGGGTLAAGCGAGVTEPPPSPPSRAPYETRRPPQIESSRTGEETAPAANQVEVSWETDSDAKFARFLRDNAGGMIKKAAVGLEKRGELKVEISRAVEPEETLTLTKSLMAGVRKDFPDRPITLSLYDPQDAPILKARYRPGEGVHYQIAPGKSQGQTPATTSTSKPAGDPLTRGGVTERDQAFAAWAETHGKSMLRYVEADLERHGRLWFGVTRDVKPEEVRPLTTSLLKGAQRVSQGGARGHRIRPRWRADRSRPPGTRWRCALGTIVVNPGSRPNRRGENPMPQWGNQDYKSAVFEQLAKGSGSDAQETDHFEHFSNFSAGAPRRDVEAGVGEALHPEAVSPDQMEPQLRDAASKIQPQERSEIAKDLLDELQQRGLAPSWLQKMLGLGSSDPRQASADDVAKLAEYSRQNHPEVFKRIMADKPFLVRWLSKPLVAALVGVIAGKLMNRAYDH